MAGRFSEQISGTDRVFATQLSVVAELDVTEQDDTLFSAPERVANLARTEGDDTLQAGASVAAIPGNRFSRQITAAGRLFARQLGGGAPATSVAADLQRTEADDTLAAHLAVEAEPDSLVATFTVENPTGLIVADADISEASDTLLADGVVFTPVNVQVTEADDTVLAESVVVVTARLQATEQNDTSTADAIATTFAVLDATEGDDFLVSSTATDDIIDVALDVLEQSDTLEAATSALIAGSTAFTEANDTALADAFVIVTAALAVNEGNDGLVGAFGPVAGISLDLSAMEVNDTLIAWASLGQRIKALRLRAFENSKRPRWD